MEQYLGFMLVILGGALAAGLAGSGSAIGCGIVGQAASGGSQQKIQISLVYFLYYKHCLAHRGFTGL